MIVTTHLSFLSLPLELDLLGFFLGDSSFGGKQRLAVVRTEYGGALLFIALRFRGFGHGALTHQSPSQPPSPVIRPKNPCEHSVKPSQTILSY